VAERLGQLLGLAMDDVARLTTENAARVFGNRVRGET